MSKDIKKRIEAAKAKIGKDALFDSLYKAKVGVGTIQKLLAGTYESEPGKLLSEAIEKALASK